MIEGVGKARKPGIIFSAPVLALDVVMMAEALASRDVIEQLVTRWCFTQSEWRWARRLPLAGAWLRRPWAPVSRACLKRLAGADLRRCVGRWLDRDVFQTMDQSFQIVDRTAADLLKPETIAVIGREDGCLACFRRAKQFNLPRIYQLPTAHYATVERLLRRERELMPQAFTPGELEADFAPARIRRKDLELKLATQVLCASSFVAESLSAGGIAPDRVAVLPLGVDRGFGAAETNGRNPVFLYVGTISVRKGVHRLIRIWKHLGAHKTHRLRLIGDLRLPACFLAEYRNVFEHLPRVARSSLVSEYHKAQAFVFNALADGFGYVMAEAMACGTAVLASRNSAAPDFIRDGEDGWLFDFGNDEALAAALDRALSSPQRLVQMGESGRRRALQQDRDRCASAFLQWISAIIGPSQSRFQTNSMGHSQVERQSPACR